MVAKEPGWECGIRTEGHQDNSIGPETVTLGENGFEYAISADNWGTLSEGWVYKEGTSVAIDSNDQVYVFNRGTCPMIVFDTDGDVLRTWGEGVSKNPHGVTIAPDGSVFCVDNGDSTIRQFSPAGDLIKTLGTPNKPAPKMSGDPFVYRHMWHLIRVMAIYM